MIANIHHLMIYPSSPNIFFKKGGVYMPLFTLNVEDPEFFKVEEIDNII